jgi:hypothetical protein
MIRIKKGDYSSSRLGGKRAGRQSDEDPGNGSRHNSTGKSELRRKRKTSLIISKKSPTHHCNAAGKVFIIFQEVSWVKAGGPDVCGGILHATSHLVRLVRQKSTYHSFYHFKTSLGKVI